MSSDMISIARSGANAARTALDITAQNIANAGTEGYVRRSVSLAEVSGAGTLYQSDVSLHGVRVAGIVRNADAFRTAEVRRTGADLARASAEVTALTNVESALEQSGVSDAIAALEASLTGLKPDPTNPALRATVIENAHTLADALNVADAGLDAAKADILTSVGDGLVQLNQLSSSLVQLNQRLLRTPDGSSDQAGLLDQRDSLLQTMSKIAGVSVSIGNHQTVTVSLGGVDIVSVTGSVPVGATTAPDGNLSFDVGGTAVAVSSGSLAGLSLGLTQLNDARTRIDALAAGIASAVNGAQANGVALDGSPGQPIFAGSTAGDIHVLTTSGAALATAPSGAAANSRNIANLDAMIAAFDAGNVFSGFDDLLTDVSSSVAGRTITRDSLAIVANGAAAALGDQAGVSLDDEAANLLRFQQAFQASGRIMQVARDLFDTILSIR